MEVNNNLAVKIAVIESASGFRSHREQNRFAKLVSIATIFQMDPDWDEGVVEATRINCQKEADRLKFQDGWQSCGSYEDLKQWFFQTYRHKEI